MPSHPPPIFEHYIIQALDKFIADQPDKPDQIEALKRILSDWFATHGYLPLDGE